MMRAKGRGQSEGVTWGSASSRSWVIWQVAHTQVRSSVMRWRSRLSVHGIMVLAPQPGQTSVAAPERTLAGSHGIAAFMAPIIP